jgi:prophage regulatory protein
MSTQKPVIDRMIGTREMLQLTSLPLSSVYDGMRAGWFPKNRKISPKRVGWRESELRDFLNSREQFGSKAA